MTFNGKMMTLIKRFALRKRFPELSTEDYSCNTSWGVLWKYYFFYTFKVEVILLPQSKLLQEETKWNVMIKIPGLSNRDYFSIYSANSWGGIHKLNHLVLPRWKLRFKTEKISSNDHLRMLREITIIRQNSKPNFKENY